MKLLQNVLNELSALVILSMLTIMKDKNYEHEKKIWGQNLTRKKTSIKVL